MVAEKKKAAEYDSGKDALTKPSLPVFGCHPGNETKTPAN